jgi:hypothetical protein
MSLKKLGNIGKAPSIAEIQDRIEELRPLVGLVTHPEMIKWIEKVEADIGKLDRAKWSANGNELAILAKETGLGSDPSASDLFTLFLCARAVVLSWRKRLDPLKKAEAEFQTLNKELEKLGAR